MHALACIGPTIVERYVPPRGKHRFEIFGRRRPVVESPPPSFKALHRAFSPVATLMRIGSASPLIVVRELRAIARGWFAGEAGRDDDSDVDSSASPGWEFLSATDMKFSSVEGDPFHALQHNLRILGIMRRGQI